MERVRRPRAGRGEAARPRATPPPSAGLLALQRSAGNRAVAGMLQRALRHDPSELGATSYEDEAGGGTAVPLATLVQEIIEAEPGLADKEDAVTEQLQK